MGSQNGGCTSQTTRIEKQCETMTVEEVADPVRPAGWFFLNANILQVESFESHCLLSKKRMLKQVRKAGRIQACGPPSSCPASLDPEQPTSLYCTQVKSEGAERRRIFIFIQSEGKAKETFRPHPDTSPSPHNNSLVFLKVETFPTPSLALHPTR